MEMVFTIEDVVCVGENDKSIRVKSDNEDAPEDFHDGNTVFIPQSQVSPDSEVYGEGHKGKLVVSHWLARQRGWEE